RPEQARTPVERLSGGQRGRLLLARTLAKPSNLLVLDEPTNDLDLETLDLLQELLASYKGTLLIVSHDRDFLTLLQLRFWLRRVADPGSNMPAVIRTWSASAAQGLVRRCLCPGVSRPKRNPPPFGRNSQNRQPNAASILTNNMRSPRSRHRSRRCIPSRKSFTPCLATSGFMRAIPQNSQRRQPLFQKPRQI